MLTDAGGRGFSGLTRKPVPRWVACLQLAIFVGIGVAVLISGIRRYDAAVPIPGGRTTTGTVVAVTTGQSCGRHGCSGYWVPDIKFTANGHDVTFTGPESSSPVSTGDPVQVSYDPRDPAAARDLSAGVGKAWLLIVAGALAILAGPASFLLGLRPFQTMLGLTSARDGDGWVGHRDVHSVQGISISIAALVAIVILQHAAH